MGDNRGILGKRLASRVKLSCSPFKPQFWSLDPTHHSLMSPDCNNLATCTALCITKIFSIDTLHQHSVILLLHHREIVWCLTRFRQLTMKLVTFYADCCIDYGNIEFDAFVLYFIDSKRYHLPPQCAQHWQRAYIDMVELCCRPHSLAEIKLTTSVHNYLPPGYTTNCIMHWMLIIKKLH